MKTLHHRWMIIAMCANTVALGYSADSYKSRSLNPYHERQIEQDIYQTASKVQACKDAESRSKELQELCKKLIQAEKYDDALRVADQVHRTPNINAERKAAHHFLIADIYARKMDASPSVEHMKQNRNLALQATQDVINQKYPAKWGVTGMANMLKRDLEDPKRLSRVQDKIQKRQSNGVDAGRANLAQRQLQYMEGMAKGTVSATASGLSAVKRTGSNFFKFGRKDSSSEIPQPSAGRGSGAQVAEAPSAQSGRNNVTLPDGGQVTFSQSAADGYASPAVNSPWSVRGASATRAPIIIDGASVRRSTPVQSAMARTNLPSLGGSGTSSAANGAASAPRTASTYANGEFPTQARN